MSLPRSSRFAFFFLSSWFVLCTGFAVVVVVVLVVVVVVLLLVVGARRCICFELTASYLPLSPIFVADHHVKIKCEGCAYIANRVRVRTSLHVPT